MPTKRPPTVFLMELSEELRARRVVLDLDWLPRDENQEADDLGHMKTSGFDDSRRIRGAPEDLKWHVLDEMTKASQELFEAV